MENKLSIKDLDIKSKKVLIRVDFNVPLNDDGKITDDSRIRASLPTIEYAISQKAKIILMSHLGKPKGTRNEKYTLKPVAKRLFELLTHPVEFIDDCMGKAVEKKVSELQDQQILLLENLRFYEAEEKPEKDPEFAKQLASLADVYINDAFGTAHRKHSSTYTIAEYFPNKAAAGLLMEKEIHYLTQCIENPEKPFYAILGGAKISTKIGVVKNLIKQVDALFIGGGMAYTFFKAQGKSIGNSIYEQEEVDKVKPLLEEEKLQLPEDILIADQINEDAHTKTITTDKNIPDGWEGVDIGPKTIEKWKESLQDAKLIFWNGPLGIFEIKKFAKGTNEIAQFLAALSAKTIIGGGDSLAAVQSQNLGNQFTHLSTGGGASLEFIEKGSLPGIEALSNKN